MLKQTVKTICGTKDVTVGIDSKNNPCTIELNGKVHPLRLVGVYGSEREYAYFADANQRVVTVTETNQSSNVSYSVELRHGRR